MSVDSARLTGDWGRSARARRVVGSDTPPSVGAQAAVAVAISAGSRKTHHTVGADESRQPFGGPRTEAGELVIVDVLGERPAPDLGVQPVVERGEARLAFAADHPDVSERRPHQVAELVGRAKAKRRPERLGRPVADLVVEQVDHRRVAR